ncbi:beta-1,4-glucosyltransferase [Aeromonas sp. RU39B]|uniref:WecB/TagA/CpsF family glycosyltransferase n=1 Tax=Aeromonas sp. RU39B TaxID=1907416 RepID=UPI000956CDDB|nr:WecB/TagA/CpsF family glycosyltransferase [Aeromonas sp. RU39B]SIQ61024.1 beta-1,4-glucosyltransferase [Aeromonas sp. RU39B]
MTSEKNILGFHLFNGSAPELIALLSDKVRAFPNRVSLFYGNSNLFNHCHRDVASFSRPEVVMANDGIALDVAARLLTGSPFAANLNGTDFTPRLMRESALFRRAFLLGGQPGVASRAAITLMGQGIEVVGEANGFADMSDEAALIERINQSQPDILLVALGNPAQEYWILRHREQLAVPLVVGVGALLDFLSGRVSRAPNWVQAVRCEWLYRLALEPRRLLRRYTLDMGRFFLLCLMSLRHAGGRV